MTQDCVCQQRVPSQLKKPFVGEGRRESHEQGNGRDLILVFLKSWRLTLKLDSDHTCANAVVAEALAPYPAMILCFLLNHLYTRTFGGKLDIA